jgi:hypothetical protein
VFHTLDFDLIGPCSYLLDPEFWIPDFDLCLLPMMIGFKYRFYYLLKPLIPRRLQISLRRFIVMRTREKYRSIWPVDERAARKPEGWKGWPEGKQFALILTHDVETAKGQERCYHLAELEERLGFRSSFNFVPEGYKVDAELRYYLTGNGFEVGVHGLCHDAKYFDQREEFRMRANKIIVLYA